MLKPPVRAPVAVGVKVMLTVQFAPPAKGLAQVEVWAKSPVVARVPITSGVADVFEMVNLIGVLVAPTFVVGKVNEVCERFTAVAVPLTSMVTGFAGSLLWMLTPP